MSNQSRFFISAILCFGVFYLLNASWLATAPEGETMLLSHRGVHQTFSREGLTHESCTAEQIFPPSHDYLENTLASMEAAFALGADVVELDIHPTTDGAFVVFHDWTLDCRTNGTGRTRDYTLAELQALDIGYGYMADGGKTYPFRGRFIGAMPCLSEVLQAFPDRRFVLNFKSRQKSEGEAFVVWLGERRPPAIAAFAGHETLLDPIRAAWPDAIFMSRQRARQCAKSYGLLGWTGYMPRACENAYMPVPANYRWAVWGWPHRFERRLRKVGSSSLLLGPLTDTGTVGLESVEDLKYVPDDYKGIVFTNRIEVTGPKLKPELKDEHP